MIDRVRQASQTGTRPWVVGRFLRSTRGHAVALFLVAILCRADQIESQAWWTGSGHIHLATDAPIGGHVSGLLRLPVRVVLHENHAELVEIRAKDHRLGLLDRQRFDVPPDMVQEGSTRTMASVVEIDTEQHPDGWHAVGVFAIAEEDGMRFFTSIKVQIYFANGNRLRNTVHDSPDLAGTATTTYTVNAWQQDVGYATIRLTPTSYQVTPIRPQSTVVFFDKGHAIPEVPGWPREEAQAGTQQGEATADEKQHSFLAAAGQMVNINSLSVKGLNGKFLTVVGRRWF